MRKLLGKNWISTTSPPLFVQMGWGTLVLTLIFVFACMTYAQTRKSAASIPYNFSKQSARLPNSSAARPTPIRQVQAQQELGAFQDDDPFGLVPTDFGTDEISPAEEQVPMYDLPGDYQESSDSDRMEEFLQETDDSQTTVLPGLFDEEEEVESPPSRKPLPTLQENTGTRRPSRQTPTFGIPSSGLDLDDLDIYTEEEKEILEKFRREEEIRQQKEKEYENTPKKTPGSGIAVPPVRIAPPLPDLVPNPIRTDDTPIRQDSLRQPTVDESVASTLDAGKRRARRVFQDCNVGRDMVFQDQHGSTIEMVPFAGFFVDNPCAPLFDFGGSGTDFFGYQRGCPSARPCGWLFDNMEVFAGACGFGLRSDDIKETNFGLHEGVNWSGSISPRFGVAAQFGVRAVQRTIDGTNPLLEEAEWTNNGGSQVFITTGIFRRAQSQPFQYGFVYDWMSDKKYQNRRTQNGKTLDSFNLGQFRTELSYRHCCGFTWGFRGAFGTSQSDLFAQDAYTTKATTQMHGFFEKPLWCGSLAGFSAGGSAKGNAILAAYFDQPLSDKFSLKSGFTYMLPKNGKNESVTFIKDERNAWEAAITLTFHPHGGAFSKNRNPIRAMFDVAGNGSMIVSHKK